MRKIILDYVELKRHLQSGQALRQPVAQSVISRQPLRLIIFAVVS